MLFWSESSCQENGVSEPQAPNTLNPRPTPNSTSASSARQRSTSQPEICTWSSAWQLSDTELRLGQSYNTALQHGFRARESQSQSLQASEKMSPNLRPNSSRGTDALARCVRSPWRARRRPWKQGRQQELGLEMVLWLSRL